MKHLPRALNRFLLFLIGLILLAVGGGLLTISFSAKAAAWWNRSASNLISSYSRLEKSVRTVFNPDLSWATLGIFAVLLVVIVLLLIWILRQGGGGTRKVDIEESVLDKGLTVASLKFVEALVVDTLGEDRWIASIKASGWKVKGVDCLMLKVVTQKGACPTHLKEKLDMAIARLDRALGKKVPIYVLLTTGWQTTFNNPARVDVEHHIL